MDSVEKNRVEPSTLYLVATPIGNLADMSERAIKVLSGVDFVAAEDTRNSMRLLMCFGIKKELVSYYEHNKAKSGDKILARLLSGESCALITDAGMPAISDPGEDIVVLCAKAGIRVLTVPGCCAAVSALSLSGLPTGRFCFEGFLSAHKGERARQLEGLKGEERTMIFYEAPHKLRSTLSDMKEILGEDRRIALCRELTKLNEETERTTLGGACAIYEEREPRGEYVLVVEGAGKVAPSDNPLCELSPKEHVEFYINNGMERKDAIKAAAKDRGMPKSDFYKLLI
ncbi:MAG: 16S rRNA (cytidine(1402)-2'-O)-methyltransferase [Clostridia bacterium]|nr:16S rRNA (cytidine(1402)-2'-O)-methyltransferase [Clostridia bacterium]